VTEEEVEELLRLGRLRVGEHELTSDEVRVTFTFTGADSSTDLQQVKTTEKNNKKSVGEKKSVEEKKKLVGASVINGGVSPKEQADVGKLVGQAAEEEVDAVGGGPKWEAMSNNSVYSYLFIKWCEKSNKNKLLIIFSSDLIKIFFFF
jgi:hypothetical protein